MKTLVTALLLCGSLMFAQEPAKDTHKKAKKPMPPAAKVETKTEVKTETKTEVKEGFVGRKNGHYHRPTCKHAAKIKPAHRVVYATKADAEKDGAKPCKVCKP